MTRPQVTKLMQLCSLLLLILGVAVFAGALIKRERAKPEKPVPFVVTYQHYRRTQNSVTPTGMTVKVVNAERAWREVTFYTGGARTEDGSDGESCFNVSGDSLQYQQEDNTFTDQFNSEVALRNNPEFVRTETVAGLTTFVLRSRENDGFWFEQWYSPKTGGLALKLVVHDTMSERITEAVSVQFRDVSEQEVSLPPLPVRLDDAEKEVLRLRSGGEHETADRLEAGVRRIKEKAQASSWMRAAE